MIDPDNPVVKLCAEGMQAEAKQHFDEAKRLFERAWEASKDDYEAVLQHII